MLLGQSIGKIVYIHDAIQRCLILLIMEILQEVECRVNNSCRLGDTIAYDSVSLEQLHSGVCIVRVVWMVVGWFGLVHIMHSLQLKRYSIYTTSILLL